MVQNDFWNIQIQILIESPIDLYIEMLFKLKKLFKKLIFVIKILVITFIIILDYQELLANELQCLFPGTKVTIIPVVMTWDGLVTRHFKRYMNQLQVSKRLQAYMQTVVLKKTCESILTDMRKRQDWLEEEVSQLMDQMEVNPAGPEESEIL